jgi:demethylmenaquinone methyltransferase/2-methoxy-6-polyprenyl-1,4-benzoquinol methylase
MSGSYERMNFITSFGFSIIWRKQFLRKLRSSQENNNIIDLLSGLGESWKSLNQKYPNGNLYALDFSEEMISKSEFKNSNSFNNKFKIRQEDLLNNHLSSNYFDFVSCAFGLKTFNEEQLYVFAETLNRILKQNGEFSFIEISVPSNPVLKFFFGFYLGKIIPVLGKLFLGNPSDYKLLWKYTTQFKNCKEVQSIFEKNNLEVKYHSYFFGCATGVSGRKK